MNQQLLDDELEAEVIPAEPKKEPVKPPSALSIQLIGWILYSTAMGILLGPWLHKFGNYWEYASACLILGHFSSQLNAVKNKL